MLFRQTLSRTNISARCSSEKSVRAMRLLYLLGSSGYFMDPWHEVELSAVEEDSCTVVLEGSTETRPRQTSAGRASCKSMLRVLDDSWHPCIAIDSMKCRHIDGCTEPVMVQVQCPPVASQPLASSSACCRRLLGWTPTIRSTTSPSLKIISVGMLLTP